MTAVSNQQGTLSGVAQIKEHKKGESPWTDAFRRLRRNRAAMLGAIIIILNILMAIAAPLIAPKPYDLQVLTDNNAVPTWVTNLFPNMKPVKEGGYVAINETYSLGADSLGRDMLSRIIYGAQVSLEVAAVGPAFSIMVGLLVGMLAGYAGGKVDNLLMRVVDIMYAFPTFLLVILLMAFFRTTFGSVPAAGATQAPNDLWLSIREGLGALDTSMGGMLFIFIGIGLTSWMQMARLVRGQVLSVREKEYIEAARSIGTPNRSIMLRHVLPNILGPLIVAETLTIPTYISYEAFLSFIGLGVNPPRPSWGQMISEGARVIQTYPYQALFPAMALFFLMFAFNFLGDGLRDAFDPRMRGVD